MLLLVAFIVLQITLGSRSLPRFQDDVIWTMVTIVCWYTPACQSYHQAFSCVVWLVSIITSQAMLSLIYWRHGVHADDADADDDVGGMQFYRYGVGVGVVVGVAFTISHTAVTCWVCSPSPVLQSNSRVQQKLGVFALPYTSMFTLSNTAVTCWVCFPSPVLMSSCRVWQKLGVVALPYTLMFMLLLVLLLVLPYVIQQ